MTRTTAPVPWYLTAVLLAATSTVVGVIWDISWHRTIGRDTFWTPAHMAIYLGGVLALLGLPRPAGRVGGHLGCVRHDRERAVRQLVAQRVRAGRESAVAAARAAGPGLHRHSAGRLVDGAGAAKPLDHGTHARPQVDVRVRRGPAGHERDDHGLQSDRLRQRHAQRAVLSGR